MIKVIPNSIPYIFKTIITDRGGFRGADAPSSGIRPPADPKGPPALILFQKSIFGRPTLKFFYRRLGRQYILTLRGSARQNNAFFPFLACFSRFCLRRRKFCLNRDKTVLWESSKNQFGRPKKKKRSSKFWKIF